METKMPEWFAAWSNNFNKELDQRFDKVEARIDDLKEYVDERFDNLKEYVDERFVSLIENNNLKA